VKTLSISLAITITLAATGASVTWANTAVYGAYDPRQQESLWNTAIELQAQGRHEEAIPVLKRATHLSRISDGLNAASQLNEVLRYFMMGSVTVVYKNNEICVWLEFK